MTGPVRSVDTNAAATVTVPDGAVAHRDHVAHSDVLRRQFVEVRPGVWTFVGNGLSNQTFVEGPDGVIAIDTGESREEMREALRLLREKTSRPIAAVVYTHFHYVEGTQAIIDEGNHDDPLPIYGHPRVGFNRGRIATEIAPAYTRGIVEQFGIFMPDEGPDALVNDGLGLYFRNPSHAPFTPGHLPVTRPFVDGETIRIAGLEIEVDFAPSDSDDSVTLWFSSLGLCVHNLVWPTLFNVFAIRGEEYRDPRVLLAGIDRLRRHEAPYLVGTHGPPLVGVEANAERTERYRDSLQYLWDQTVRGINRGMTADELAAQIRLPDLYDVDYLTSERYGIAEHHVRQIHNGLRGWFDGEESRLVPLEPVARHDRLVAGFGGRDVVADQVRAALEDGDVRWATELATWLARSSAASDEDRILLATCLRTIAQRTPSANLRNWCVARARHLDGSTPLDILYRHRFNARSLAALTTPQILSTLRVLLDPARAQDVNLHVSLVIDEERHGLHVRRGVAVVTDGTGATTTIALRRETFDDLLRGQVSVRGLFEEPLVVVTGDPDAVRRLFNCFELESLQS